MAQDSTAFIAALKEVWVSETIEDQIYQGNPLLDQIERLKPSAEVGDKALYPIHTGRSGAYSAVPRTGTSALNAADAQEVKTAEYNYTHHWFQVELDTAVIDESSKSSLAVAQAVEVEMKGATNDMRKQLTRQAFSNGDALICKTAANAEATKSIKLLASDYGYDAIQRGWLYPGLLVDIGTSTEEAVKADGVEITAVTESSTEPIIAISAEKTTAEGNFVSVKNARSGATSYEMNGLRNLISESTTVGGLESTVWKSLVDGTEQELSLPLLYERQDAVFQKTGMEPDWALTSSKQHRVLYELLQAQVRFNGDGGLGAGDRGGLKVGSTVVERQPDCTNRHFYFLTKGDLFVLRNEGPRWASEKYGGTSQPVQYVEGTTRVQGGLVYRMQLGLKRRNSHTALTNLT